MHEVQLEVILTADTLLKGLLDFLHLSCELSGHMPLVNVPNVKGSVNTRQSCLMFRVGHFRFLTQLPV